MMKGNGGEWMEEYMYLCSLRGRGLGSKYNIYFHKTLFDYGIKKQNARRWWWSLSSATSAVEEEQVAWKREWW